jgi:hypothetical protein
LTRLLLSQCGATKWNEKMYSMNPPPCYSWPVGPALTLSCSREGTGYLEGNYQHLICNLFNVFREQIAMITEKYTSFTFELCARERVTVDLMVLRYVVSPAL